MGRKRASCLLLGILGIPIPWGQVGQKEMGLLRANHTYSLKSPLRLFLLCDLSFKEGFGTPCCGLET